MTTKFMHTECPCCGENQQMATGLQAGTTPRPGDITVVIRCGAICEFDQDLALRLFDGRPPETALMLQRAVREMRGLPVDPQINQTTRRRP